MGLGRCLALLAAFVVAEGCSPTGDEWSGPTDWVVYSFNPWAWFDHIDREGLWREEGPVTVVSCSFDRQNVTLARFEGRYCLRVGTCYSLSVSPASEPNHFTVRRQAVGGVLEVFDSYEADPALSDWWVPNTGHTLIITKYGRLGIGNCPAPGWVPP